MPRPSISACSFCNSCLYSSQTQESQLISPSQAWLHMAWADQWRLGLGSQSIDPACATDQVALQVPCSNSRHSVVFAIPRSSACAMSLAFGLSTMQKGMVHHSAQHTVVFSQPCLHVQPASCMHTSCLGDAGQEHSRQLHNSRSDRQKNAKSTASSVHAFQVCPSSTTLLLHTCEAPAQFAQHPALKNLVPHCQGMAAAPAARAPGAQSPGTWSDRTRVRSAPPSAGASARAAV